MRPGEPDDDVVLHGTSGHAGARARLPPLPIPRRDDREPPLPDFEAFYRTERPRILAVVAGLVGDWGIAEDVAQESFAEAYRRWRTVGRYDRPGAWVRRVAINRAISRVRRHRIEARVLSRVGLAPDAYGDTPVMDAELWAAVRRLPHRQAQVVALAYIEDLTMPQIAEVLGCSKDSVKTHLRRARERLAREVPDLDERATGSSGGDRGG